MIAQIKQRLSYQFPIEIEYLISYPEFTPYIEVFNQFGFGTNLKARIQLSGFCSKRLGCYFMN
ncbi:MAG: hypothetical protein Kow0049_26240 [Stanieria sp.]|jgi:hypothetical protein